MPRNEAPRTPLSRNSSQHNSSSASEPEPQAEEEKKQPAQIEEEKGAPLDQNQAKDMMKKIEDHVAGAQSQKVEKSHDSLEKVHSQQEMKMASELVNDRRSPALSQNGSPIHSESNMACHNSDVAGCSNSSQGSAFGNYSFQKASQAAIQADLAERQKVIHVRQRNRGTPSVQSMPDGDMA